MNSKIIRSDLNTGETELYFNFDKNYKLRTTRLAVVLVYWCTKKQISAKIFAVLNAGVVTLSGSNEIFRLDFVKRIVFKNRPFTFGKDNIFKMRKLFYK